MGVCVALNSKPSLKVSFWHEDVHNLVMDRKAYVVVRPYCYEYHEMWSVFTLVAWSVCLYMCLSVGLERVRC